MAGLGSLPDGVNELIIPAETNSRQVMEQIFLRLITEQPDFQDHPPTFEPALARSWEWSDDRTTVTFHLDPRAKWSDGTPVTATDVRFTWEAQTHPDIAWEGAYAKEHIEDVEVVDAHTVRFHFSHVFPVQLLHANEGFILPSHLWSELPFSQWRRNAAWFRERVVTNGPFNLESLRPGEEIVVLRNEDYELAEPPLLDRVIFRRVSDQTSQNLQLRAGDLDFVSNISPDEAESLAAHPDLEVSDFWSIAFVFLVWNVQEPALADPAVRRAMTHAIDRQRLVESIWGPYARPIESLILPNIWLNDESLEPLDYDPDAARELLAEAGWSDTDGDGVVDKDGRPLAFEILNHTGNQQRVDATVIAVQDLKAVGVGATQLVIDYSAFIERLQRQEYAAALFGLTLGTDLDLRAFFHSSQIRGLNFAAYANPEMDALLDEAAQQPDMAAVEPYLTRAQEILRRDQPMTFLWQSKRLLANNQRVQGIEPTILSHFANLSEWWVTEPR